MSSELNFNQESEPEMPEDADDLQRSTHSLSLLHLNCFNSHNHTHPPCTTCGCCGSSFPSPTPPLPPSTDLHINPLKRRSPEPSTALVTATAVTDSSEPIAKKLFQDQQQTHSGQENSTLPGFNKVSLPSVPVHFQESSFPVLRRCASDPCNPPQSPPENSKIPGGNASTPSSYSASLPPLPPSLRRSVSDPMPSPAKSFSRWSSSNEMGPEQSTNSKRLKRMKEGLKEMKMWWEELLNEAEEATAAEEITHNLSAQADSVAEFEEAVTVERTGDCLLVNFKCPCGKGYQFLLSGKSCYYKLI
ncbi:hypothetical protein HS088_TW14G00843 [Tripterygium wilfordii]|uniref:Uncharacterized protein n=1 Tax=Tripterygium wilfordii TaxID=458696 RepID=A0A7J7CRG4_TRIWF|nr:uncharacterized protein LOC120015566 [Tripterygium wilfordii]KAF5736693.1 hypothetical protein HS088_TW14G00843 [Tripterygium wilfordii]